MSIRLVTLGPPRCFIAETLTDLPAQKHRFALLLYLAMQRRVARESVAAVFWPEKDEDRARHTLSQTLYELRRALGEDWLVAQADPLEVTERVEVDATRFERLVAKGELASALDLYHGDFLDGFHLKGSNAFESWVEGRRRELKRLHHRASRDHIGALLERQRLGEALEYANRWVALDPLDDEANHSLIQVLALSGRRVEAITHYESYETNLRTELDVAPLDETRALIQQLRADSPAPSRPDSGSEPAKRRAGASPPHISGEDATNIFLPRSRWEQIKQSRVARTVAVYAASSFVVVQFADVMVPALNLPDSIITITAALALLLFPFALTLAWLGGDVASGDRLPTAYGQEELAVERARGRMLRQRAVIVTGFAIVVSAVLLYAAITNREMSAADAITADSTLYLVMPFEQHAGVPVGIQADDYIRDAISRYDGVSVMEPFQVREFLARSNTHGVTTAQEAARHYGAGRVIVGEIGKRGDSLRIFAVVYDATGLRLRTLGAANINVAPNFENADPQAAELVENLLLARSALGTEPAASAGSVSVPARIAFSHGLDAVQNWKLDAADTLFERALKRDPDYARAKLWLAFVRAWAGRDTALWKPVAEQAASDTMSYGPRERALARGLAAVSRGNYSVACETFRAIRDARPNDFIAWYSLADCISRDDIVVADPSSPSRWAFRSSYHEATNAYRHAFQLLPSMHRALAAGSYQQVRRVLRTSPTALRHGRALSPDTTQFQAYAAFGGDTLQYVPYTTADFGSGRAPTPATLGRAVHHQREVFRAVSASWVAAFPRSAVALRSAALALELAGDATALDTLRKARTLATDDAEAFGLALSEFAASLRFHFPHNLNEIRRARELGDSLLANDGFQTLDPVALAAVAVFLGRGERAAALMRSTHARRQTGAPLVLGDAGLGLQIYSALGAPVDSIRVLEGRVNAQLPRVSPNIRPLVFNENYIRPALMAYGAVQFADLATAAENHLTVRAQLAHHRGDYRGAELQLAQIRALRRGNRPEDLSMDAALAEADLLMRLGRPDMALEWLLPPLASLRETPPGRLLDPVIAAATVRASLLAAELLRSQRHEQRARSWARGVRVLLRHPDPLMRPLQQRADRVLRAGR